MKRAYNEIYLQMVVEEQGRFFESLQYAHPELDGIAAITDYMKSEVRASVDRGDAWYLTLDAAHIQKVYFETAGKSLKQGKPLTGFLPQWIGEFYALSQWYWNIPSRELVERIPVTDLCAVYPGAHDLDLRLAVDKLGRPIFGSATAA